MKMRWLLREKMERRFMKRREQRVLYCLSFSMCQAPPDFLLGGCGFSPDVPAEGYGVLGQVGFFDRFKVVFDLQQEEIEVIPK